MSSERIVECKLGWGGVSVNVPALFRRILDRPNPSPVSKIPRRFIKLFADHGVSKSQIPHWIPDIELTDVQDHARLLGKLKPETLVKAAEIFGVQRIWIEGETEKIFDTESCYKQPEKFFRRIPARAVADRPGLVRALIEDTGLDNRKAYGQPLVLVIVEPLKESEDRGEMWSVDRYHIFGDSWDWSHAPCRIQLKAMARVMDRVFGYPTPIFKVNQRELEAVRSGKRVPRDLVNRCLMTDPSLEDYACSAEESRAAKETEELPAVLSYIEQSGLERHAREAKAKMVE